MRNLQMLEGLAKTLALPGDNKPMRLPSFPALERTAVMGFNTSTGADVTAFGADSYTKMLLMRQAVHPCWFSQTVSGVSYGIARLINTGSQQPAALASDTCTAWYNGIRTGLDLGLGFPQASAVTMFGGRPLLALDPSTGPAEWLYSLPVTMIGFTSTAAGAITVSATLEKWVAPGEFVTQTVVSGSGTVVIGYNLITAFTGGSALSPGWYRISNVTASTGINITSAILYTSMGGATVTATGASFLAGGSRVLVPLSVPTEYNNSKLPWTNTRVTAVGALVTNTTKALNKEGTVLWGRLAPEQVNVWAAGQADVNTLHPAEKKFLPLEEGTYSYVMPSTDLATFYDYTDVLDLPVVRLDNDSMVNVAFFYDPDGGTSVAVNIDWHLEFRTTSSLFQIGMSRLPVEALHQAQLTLLELGFFYKNDDHRSMISRGISSLAKLAPIFEIMGPIGSGISKGVRVADTIMNRRSAPPPATSLRTAITDTSRRSKKVKTPKKRSDSARPKMKSGLDMYLQQRKKK